jgi:murein DD-endopeptidase MepM/ murein hydrolase activator NlpD
MNKLLALILIPTSVVGTGVGVSFAEPMISTPALPSCTVYEPVDTETEGFIGWAKDGEMGLEAPENWSVFRVYDELKSYGLCDFEVVTPSAHNVKQVNVNDYVGGYRVSSGFGKREKPCTGCSSFHPAFDLATPVGTPLYAPGNINVVCFWDDGGGNVGQFEWQGMTHQFLHLQDCVEGSRAFGDVFATTGSSGRGTGPHLDYRVKQPDASGNQVRVYPPQEVLQYVLDPTSFINF